MKLYPVRLFPLLFCIGCVALLSAQSGSVTPQLSELPGIIDGSKNPESIPDLVALAALFGHVGDQPRASSHADRRAYFASSGLRAESINAIIRRANEYTAEVQRETVRFKKVRARGNQGETDKTWEQVQKTLNALTERLKTELVVELGPEEYGKFLHFLQTIAKANMHYYPGVRR